MKKRPLYTPDLQEFILCTDNDTMLTDACKCRILSQFLRRFRLEFDTDLEFHETIQAIYNNHKINH